MIMELRDTNGNKMKLGVDYEVKDGFIIPHRPIMSISYEKTIENKPNKPNRAQRRHPLKG